MASSTGLHILCSEGTVQSTICNDTFYDVGFFGEDIVGLNSSKKILQTYGKLGDGNWKHSSDIGAPQGIGSSEVDSLVTSDGEVVFTMCGTNCSKYYKCQGKTGQRMEFGSTEEAMRYPFVCGVDSTGAVLVADHYNKKFQIHESGDKCSVVVIEPTSSHCQYSFLYDAGRETAWAFS